MRMKPEKKEINQRTKKKRNARKTDRNKETSRVIMINIFIHGTKKG
jgi:hypothetical protein